jgi:putative transposase
MAYRKDELVRSCTQQGPICFMCQHYRKTCAHCVCNAPLSGSISSIRLAPAIVNTVWSYDFIFDACANGQQLKCLTIVDEYSRESLAIDGAGSIRSQRVIEVLSKLISVRGAPRYLHNDHGPEFVSTALLKWITEQEIASLLIEPGKPRQNGTAESFNGKFRDEYLSREGFCNRLEAKVVIED